MTDKQIVLAMDAVMTAAENRFNDAPVLRDAIDAFRSVVDAVINDAYSDADFGTFLDEQMDAVKALCNNPAVFGGE
jgi:hypothetical protein